MPLLLPLRCLPRRRIRRCGAAHRTHGSWFAVTVFTFLRAGRVGVLVGLELGVPPGLHAHLHRIQPGYTPGFKPISFALRGALADRMVHRLSH